MTLRFNFVKRLERRMEPNKRTTAMTMAAT
jgi:hypothetical protein